MPLPYALEYCGIVSAAKSAVWLLTAISFCVLGSFQQSLLLLGLWPFVDGVTTDDYYPYFVIHSLLWFLGLRLLLAYKQLCF